MLTMVTADKLTAGMRVSDCGAAIFEVVSAEPHPECKGCMRLTLRKTWGDMDTRSLCDRNGSTYLLHGEVQS